MFKLNKKFRKYIFPKSKYFMFCMYARLVIHGDEFSPAISLGNRLLCIQFLVFMATLLLMKPYILDSFWKKNLTFFRVINCAKIKTFHLTSYHFRDFFHYSDIVANMINSQMKSFNFCTNNKLKKMSYLRNDFVEQIDTYFGPF